MKNLFFLLGIIFFLTGCGEDSLRVATESSFPPFDYKDGDKFAGVDNDIGLRIAKKLGKKLVINDMEFDAIIPSISAKKADLAIAGLQITETRKEIVDFSIPYAKKYQSLIAKADDERFNSATSAKDVADILNNEGKKFIVGTQIGTTAEFYLRRELPWDFEGFRDIDVRSFPNVALAITAMFNGQIDFVFTAHDTGAILASKQGAKLIDIPLTDIEHTAIAVNKENSALLKTVNEVLEEMQKDGSLEASFEFHNAKFKESK